MKPTPCPANCGRNQNPGKFLCLPCWQSLPGSEKWNLSRSWHALGTIDREKNSVEYLGALKTYRNARESALRWLAAHPNYTPTRAAVEELFGNRA